MKLTSPASYMTTGLTFRASKPCATKNISFYAKHGVVSGYPALKAKVAPETSPPARTPSKTIVYSIHPHTIFTYPIERFDGLSPCTLFLKASPVPQSESFLCSIFTIYNSTNPDKNRLQSATNHYLSSTCRCRGSSVTCPFFFAAVNLAGSTGIAHNNLPTTRQDAPASCSITERNPLR